MCDERSVCLGLSFCTCLVMVREDLKKPTKQTKNPMSGLFCTDGTSTVHFQLLDCLWGRGLKKEGSEEGWGRLRCKEAGAFYVEEKFRTGS